MRALVAILWSFFLTTSVEAGLCDDDNNYLEREFTWDFKNGFLQDLPLPMIYGGTEYPSTLILYLGNDGGAKLHTAYHWTEGGPGLFYNVYRLQIEIGDGENQQIIDEDFTKGCTDLPRSLRHGDSYTPEPFALTTHPDGTPLGVERVRLRFWGK